MPFDPAVTGSAESLDVPNCVVGVVVVDVVTFERLGLPAAGAEAALRIDDLGA